MRTGKSTRRLADEERTAAERTCEGPQSGKLQQPQTGAWPEEHSSRVGVRNEVEIFGPSQ